MIENVDALTIAQYASYFPSTDTSSAGSSFAGIDEIEVNKIKLKKFPVACKVENFGPKNWREQSSAHNRTRQRYINHTADAVAALLKIVSPENAVEIWQTYLSSKAVDNRLKKEPTITPSERALLKALAEAYYMAKSWETRR